MNPYTELLEKTERLVKYYRDDLLLHDKRAIENHGAETPFLHWTRETGTHILFLIAADKFPPKGESVPYLFGKADRDHILDQTRVFTKCCNSEMPCLVIHFWSGDRLLEVTAAQAESIIENYLATIRREWKNAA